MAKAADPWAFLSQWVMFWPAETKKQATLPNRGCVLMTKKLRLLSAFPGALQVGAALSPGKQAKLPAQEQYNGCRLAGFLAGAAVILLVYDSSSQVLLLPKH